MQDKETPASNVVYLERPQAQPKEGGDVLQTLLQSLRDAEPVAAPRSQEHPHAEAISAQIAQHIKGAGNFQALQGGALLQQIDGMHNVQLSGLNVVVRLDMPTRAPSIALSIPSTWRFVAIAAVVVLAFLC